MTTETLETTEAPAVTPVVETPVVVTPEVPAVPQVESTPEPPDILNDFFKEAGLDDASGEGETPATTEASPEVKAEASKLLQEERARDARRSQEDGVRRSFQERLPAIENGLKALGATPEQVTWFTNQFKGHHSSSAQIHRQDTATEFLDTLYAIGDELAPGFAKKRDEHAKAALERKDDRTFSPLKEAINDIVNGKMSDYVSKKDAKKQASDAVLADRKWLTDSEHPERLAALNSRAKATAEGSGTAFTGTVTYDQITKMTKAQIDALPSDVYLKAIGGG